MHASTIIDSCDQLAPRTFSRIAHQLYVYFQLFADRSSAATVTDEYILILTDAPHPLGSFVFLAEHPSLDACRSTISQLGSLERPSAIVLHREPDDTLAQIVKEHGFVLAEPMPAMGVDIDALAHTEIPDGYSFEEVSDPTSRETSDEWSHAFALGYEIPHQVADVFAPSLLADSPLKSTVRLFAARHNNQIVATSSMHLDAGMAGIYCVSTHPDHRGKGLGAHLTAEPLRLAASDGYKVGILQASAMGTPVYERLGFESFGDMMLYVRIPE